MGGVPRSNDHHNHHHHNHHHYEGGQVVWLVTDRAYQIFGCAERMRGSADAFDKWGKGNAVGKMPRSNDHHNHHHDNNHNDSHNDN